MATGVEAAEALSGQARSLWGKSDYGVGESWLPLYVHMADSAGVAMRLWDSWVPRSTRDIVSRAVDGNESLTRWLLEVSPGVFVGNVSARVRDGLWARILAMVRNGRAIMVYSAKNEQHLAFKTFQPDWQPVDCEGIELIKRPLGTDGATMLGVPQKGWSNASKYRSARRFGG